MNKLKHSVIEHESFVPMFCKRTDIFKILFAENTRGVRLHKLSTLMSRIDRVCTKLIPDFSDLYPDDYNSPGTGLNRFKGEVFEIFINGFLIICGTDARVSVLNYTPERKVNDWGVDGYGIGNNGGPLTVQIKFRSNANHLITQDELGQFAYQSIIAYNVDKDSNNLLLITSCEGLNPITASQVFMNKIRVINGEIIKNIVDDNNIFWENFLKLIDVTIKEKFSHDALYSIGLIDSELLED